MKKVLVLVMFVIFTSATIVSCEKDDLENPIENATDKDCTASGGDKCDE